MPEDRLRDLAPLLGFGKTGGRLPYETVTILVLIIFSTFYGIEYGYRGQTKITASAAKTGAQGARTDAARRDRDAAKQRLEATKSLIRAHIKTAKDPAERAYYSSLFEELAGERVDI